MDAASRLLRQGAYDEADQALQSAARSLPGDAGPLLQLGLCRLYLGQPEAALQAFQEAAALEPENPATLVFSCLALNDLDRFDEARSRLTLLRERCPAHQATDTLECLVNLRSGQIAEAAAYLDRRPDLSLSPPVISRLVLEVERRLLPGELPPLNNDPAEMCAEEPQGTSMFAGLIRMIVGIPRLLLQLPSALSASLRSSHWSRKGRTALERAVRFARGQEKEALLEGAIAAFRQARAADPESFRADFHLAEALLYAARYQGEEPFWMERLAESHRLFMDSWRKEGENPYLLHYLGRVAMLRGQVRASIRYHEEAISRFAKFPESNYALGQCHLLLGSPDRARELFMLALGSDTFLLRDRLVELVRRQAEDPGQLERPLPEPPPEVEEPADEGAEAVEVQAAEGEGAARAQTVEGEGTDGGGQTDERVFPGQTEFDEQGGTCPVEAEGPGAAGCPATGGQDGDPTGAVEHQPEADTESPGG